MGIRASQSVHLYTNEVTTTTLYLKVITQNKFINSYT